jgi:hypothetical protein
MMKTGLKMVLAGLLLVAVAVVAGCGGGGNTGSGNNFSIELGSVPATVGTGTSFNVSATITASDTTAPVNGIRISIVSSRNDIIAGGSAVTNASGVASIPLYVKKTVTTPTDLTIYAVYDGVPSPSAAIRVTPPTLVFTQPTNQTFSVTAGSAFRIVTSGVQVDVKDGNGNAIQGANVVISILSTSNLVPGSDQIVFYPGGITETIIPPFTSTLTVQTDSTGKAIVPVALDSSAPATVGVSHVYAINWKAEVQLPGDGAILTLVDNKSSSVTITATAAPAPPSLTLTPATLSFAAADPAGTTKIVTVSGGMAPYTVNSGASADIEATVSGTAITVKTLKDGGAATYQTVVTVTDSLGIASNIVVTYTK